MNTKVKSGEEAKENLIEGVNKLAKPVVSTLGSKGRYVLISKDNETVNPTKDGVTVATSISPSNKFERAGVRALHESAIQAVEESGDGTTTTTALAQSMVNDGFKAVKDGANPIDLRRGINIATKEVVEYIKSVAIPVEDDLEKIKQVSVISANNDKELGELIAETVFKVTSDGVVKIEQSQNEQTYAEFMKGSEIESGFADEIFINNNLHQTAEHHKALILMTEDAVTDFADLVPAWKIAEEANQPLILVVGKLDGAAAATVVQNAHIYRKENQEYPINVIHAYGGGRLKANYLEDLAIITGGNVLGASLGRSINEITIEDFGQCDRIISSRTKTAIFEGKGDQEKVDSRIEALKTELKEETDSHNKRILRERIAKLIGGVATLKVGGFTPLEIKERAARCDDAVRATRSAIEEGIVAGGGVTLLNAMDFLDTLDLGNVNKDIYKGVKIVQNALMKPFEIMVQNAGKDPKKIVDKLYLEERKGWLGRLLFGETLEMNTGMGYNLETEEYVDMVEHGIIDAAKVTRVALESAASVSGILITTQHVITQITE